MLILHCTQYMDISASIFILYVRMHLNIDPYFVLVISATKNAAGLPAALFI